MLKCPQCGASIEDARSIIALCPFCQCVLPRNVVQLQATIDNIPTPDAPKDNVAATIDSWTPAAEPPAPKPSTPVKEFAATIDSWTPLDEAPRAAKPPTVTGDIAATIDSWTPAIEPPTTLKPPTVTMDISATIDSISAVDVDTGFVVAPSAKALNSLTASDRRIAATIESHELAIDPRQVTGIWSKTISPDSKPWQTLKGDEVGSPKDSKLVIKSRALKTAASERTTGADYELLSVIGEGGMGVVYSARQASIDRQVAIKMLKPEAASNQERRDKFLSEAVVTGDLDHPNIVPIYDLGANEANALFYSMKRVQGTPWEAQIAQKSLAENLEVLLKVSDAIGFAHARGVVHRDLKPDNVMLGEFGEVLVMDWGLAMSTPSFRKAGSITQTISMGGTPAYMAPEMALGPIERVGPSADIYLLGAILFEIVTGIPPHAGANVMLCLQAAARNQIVPTEASGELLEIALHAMATDPADRFATVRDFQNAIRLYQDHSESIALAVRAQRDLTDAEQSDNYQAFARAIFAFEEAFALWDGNERAETGIRTARLSYARSAQRKGDFDLALSLVTGDDEEQVVLREKLVADQRDRNDRQSRLRNAKRLLAGLAAALVVVIGGAYLQIRADRDRAVTAETTATQQRDRAVSAEKVATEQRDFAEEQRLVAVKAQRAAELARVEEEKQKQAADAARAIAEQKRKDEAVARRDAEVARAKADKAQQAEEYEAYIARIGLAAAKIEENSFGHAQQLLDECPTRYRNWEWGRLAFLCRQSARDYRSEAPVDTVAFAPDGEHFASGSWDGNVRVWDIASDKPISILPYGALYVHTVAFSPDGKLLAAGGSDKQGFVKIYNAAGKVIQTLNGHADAVLSVVFSRDNKRLLTASYDGTARLWDVATGRELRKFAGHSWWVWSAVFSPDETRIATASQDGTVRVWQVADSADAEAVAPAVFTGHRGPVYTVAFSRNGKLLASGGYDNRVLVWDPNKIKPFDYEQILSGKAAAMPEFVAFEGHSGAVRCVRFSRDDELIASAGHDNTIRIWNVADRQPIKVLRGHAGWTRASVFSEDGRKLLSASHDHTAKLWNIEGYEEFRVLRGRVLTGHDDAVLSASFSHDGKQIATASRDRTAKTWDVVTGHELQDFHEGHEFLASNAVFLADGKQLLTAAIDNTTRLWDVATGTQIFAIEGTGRNAVLAVSPDGKLILTGHSRRGAQLWNARSGELVGSLDGIKSEVSAVAFSPRGDKFIIGDSAGRAYMLDTATRRELWTVGNHSSRITAAYFTPDGQRVLTASIDKTVGQSQTSDGKELASAVLKHPDSVNTMAVDPQGRFVVTACADNRARVWSLTDARLLGTLEIPDGRLTSVAISPDGRKAITAGDILANDQPDADKKLSERRPLVRVWDLGAGKPLADVKIRGNQVWSVTFSPDGRNLLTVGGNDARLWDLGTGVQRMSFSPNGALAAANFSPDRKRLVTASWDNSAKIWDATTGKSELKLTGHRRFVNAAIFSPDGTQVLTASDDRTAKLWDAATGDVVSTFKGHTDRARCATFSSDGKLVVTGSNDKTAIIWNVDTAEPQQTFTGHEWAVTSAVFSPDGTRVLTGSEDNSARIWNVATGKVLLTLRGHTAPVTSVALSPDGRRALTASQDNIAKLWDAQTGKEILTLKGHSQELTSVAFSPNGQQALTASRDGTAILWLTIPWNTP